MVCCDMRVTCSRGSIGLQVCKFPICDCYHNTTYTHSSANCELDGWKSDTLPLPQLSPPFTPPNSIAFENEGMLRPGRRVPRGDCGVPIRGRSTGEERKNAPWMQRAEWVLV